MKFIDYLNEAHISRFFMNLKNENMAIAIFTSDREDDKENNKTNFKDLKYMARRAKFGYVQAKGGYIENKGTPQEKEIDGENCIIICAKKDREEELKEFAIAMGAIYNQDSILFIDCKEDARWIGTSKRLNADLKFREELNLGKFHADKIDIYYTKIGKHKFTFEINDIVSEESSSKPTTIEMRTSDRICKKLKHCVENNIGFYESVYENKE